MTGNEFIRKVKSLGKRRNVAVRLHASRGKGSHQTLYFASVFTVVRNPKDELKRGTFHAMCSQFGIKKPLIKSEVSAVQGRTAIFQTQKCLKNEEKQKPRFCFSCSEKSRMDLFRASIKPNDL